MTEYRLKPEKIGKKVSGAYEKAEKKFVDTFLQEDGSMKTDGMAEKKISVYRKIEDGVTGTCRKKTASSLHAEAAYEAMYTTLFERIISDIMMPGIDGFAFAESVRKVNRTIPILFMSAKDNLPSKQQGFQLFFPAVDKRPGEGFIIAGIPVRFCTKVCNADTAPGGRVCGCAGLPVRFQVFP